MFFNPVSPPKKMGLAPHSRSNSYRGWGRGGKAMENRGMTPEVRFLFLLCVPPLPFPCLKALNPQPVLTSVTNSVTYTHNSERPLFLIGGNITYRLLSRVR